MFSMALAVRAAPAVVDRWGACACCGFDVVVGCCEGGGGSGAMVGVAARERQWQGVHACRLSSPIRKFG